MTKLLCAVAALVAMTALAASGQAGPAVNYNSSKSNSGSLTASPSNPGPCPQGETMVDGNCTQTDSINYNASKSNTGNVTASPDGSGTAQPGMAVKGNGVPQNNSKNISDGAAKGQADE
jgi:hypothetical protein